MSNRPTSAQLKHWEKVVSVGCMACLKDGFNTTPEIHHVKDHGYRNHDDVIGLCPQHHRYTAAVSGVLNRERDKIEFQKRYGTDQELLSESRRLTGWSKKQNA